MKYIIIGEKYWNVLDLPIKKLGLQPLYMPDNPDIDERLSGHADLSVFYPGDGTIFLAPYLRDSGFSEKLSEIGIKISYLNIKQSPVYPNDAQMNACFTEKYLFYSEKVTSDEIIALFGEKNGAELINCRQGYLNCSICAADENSVITADRGVDAACRNRGIDSLLISPGYIDLPGFDYGFIGGAAFKTDKNHLAFTGNLDRHPDKERILNYLKVKNIVPVFLTDKPAFDIGGAIII